MDKLFNIKLDNKDAQVEVRKHKKENELKLIGRERRVPGHTLFEFNMKTGDLTFAKYITKDLVLDFTNVDPAKNLLTNMKVLINENCIYVQALNRTNAIKRLKRDFNMIIS